MKDFKTHASMIVEEKQIKNVKVYIIEFDDTQNKGNKSYLSKKGLGAFSDFGIDTHLFRSEKLAQSLIDRMMSYKYSYWQPCRQQQHNNYNRNPRVKTAKMEII